MIRHAITALLLLIPAVACAADYWPVPVEFVQVKAERWPTLVVEWSVVVKRSVVSTKIVVSPPANQKIETIVESPPVVQRVPVRVLVPRRDYWLSPTMYPGMSRIGGGSCASGNCR